MTATEKPDDVVGHKTFHAEGGGFRHEPLTRAEANALIERCEKEDARRKTLMPDEQSAINLFFDAWLRLKEFGWREAIYCPKDRREFLVIEPGSTGQHHCVYEGEWPKGSWLVLSDGDMWPSHPALFKDIPSAAPQEDRGHE